MRAARSEGLSLTAQIAGRPIGVMMGIGTALNPFTVRPSYKALEGLPIEEQRKRLRDPELRRKILAEKPSDAEVAKLAQFRQLITKRWDKFFTMGDPPDYEPGPELSVAAIAARTGPHSRRGGLRGVVSRHFDALDAILEFDSISPWTRPRSSWGMRPRATGAATVAPRLLCSPSGMARGVRVYNLSWGLSRLRRPALHVLWVKNNPSTDPIQGDELRAPRRLQRVSAPSPFVFFSEHEARRSRRRALPG